MDNQTQRHPVDEMKELSRLTRIPYYAFAKMRNYQGGEYGIGILSKYPINAIEILHFVPPETESQV